MQVPYIGRENKSYEFITCALTSISCESMFTTTSKYTLCVFTISILVTVMGTIGAFVDILDNENKGYVSLYC